MHVVSVCSCVVDACCCAAGVFAFGCTALLARVRLPLGSYSFQAVQCDFCRHAVMQLRTRREQPQSSVSCVCMFVWVNLG